MRINFDIKIDICLCSVRNELSAEGFTLLGLFFLCFCFFGMDLLVGMWVMLGAPAAYPASVLIRALCPKTRHLPSAGLSEPCQSAHVYRTHVNKQQPAESANFQGLEHDSLSEHAQEGSPRCGATISPICYLAVWLSALLPLLVSPVFARDASALDIRNRFLKYIHIKLCVYICRLQLSKYSQKLRRQRRGSGGQGRTGLHIIHFSQTASVQDLWEFINKNINWSAK